MASIFIDLPASTVSIPAGASTEAKQDDIISALGAMTPTYTQSLVIDNVTVVTFAAPVGAKKAKVMALDTNTVNIRITNDGTTAPSATVGHQLQPARSEDFDGVASIKVICESVATAHGVTVSWSV